MNATNEDEQPGQAGLALLKSSTRREWWQQPYYDFSFFRQHGSVPMVWKSNRHVCVEYDKNAMYVGAASGVQLGVGIPAYVKQATFQKQAGLWHIILSESLDQRFPPIIRDLDSWQYSPVLALLKHLGIDFAVKGAYIFPEHHQVLRHFADRVRDLRTQAQDKPEEMARIKRMYTVTFGLLAHQREQAGAGYLYRPDWYYTLVAEASCRLYRQIMEVYAKEDVLPSTVQTDCIGYPQKITSLPLGPGIGQFKETFLAP